MRRTFGLHEDGSGYCFQKGREGWTINAVDDPARGVVSGTWVDTAAAAP